MIQSRYNIGDILYVRETWQHTKCLNINPEDENYGYVYKASENGLLFSENYENWNWKPSLFMPKEAARIFLKVTDVRKERLQNISEEDAICEGIEQLEGNITEFSYKSYTHKHILLNNAINSYKSLWEK
ncbi:MAG: hypothetical protein HC892_14455 [Saprospiraceae bacterium]|nr:hypothetical protein [Saprospiraceae bacterium]